MLPAGFYGVEKVQLFIRPLIVQLIGQSRRPFQLCLEGKTLLTERLKKRGKDRMRTSHPSGKRKEKKTAEIHTACCCISAALQGMCYHCWQEQQRTVLLWLQIYRRKEWMKERNGRCRKQSNMETSFKQMVFPTLAFPVCKRGVRRLSSSGPLVLLDTYWNVQP